MEHTMARRAGLKTNALGLGYPVRYMLSRVTKTKPDATCAMTISYSAALADDMRMIYMVGITFKGYASGAITRQADTKMVSMHILRNGKRTPTPVWNARLGLSMIL